MLICCQLPILLREITYKDLKTIGVTVPAVPLSLRLKNQFFLMILIGQKFFPNEIGALLFLYCSITVIQRQYVKRKMGNFYGNGRRKEFNCLMLKQQAREKVLLLYHHVYSKYFFVAADAITNSVPGRSCCCCMQTAIAAAAAHCSLDAETAVGRFAI